jgi:hypothetical protein
MTSVPLIFVYSGSSSDLQAIQQASPSFRALTARSDGVDYCYVEHPEKSYFLPVGQRIGIGSSGTIQFLPPEPAEVQPQPQTIAQGDCVEEGRKDDAGKVRYSLIPAGPLNELARVYSMGAAHYGDHNWTKGIKYSRLLDAALRHIEAYRSGRTSSEHTFEGQPLHHLAHAVFSLFALIQQDRSGREDLNDLWDPTE